MPESKNDRWSFRVLTRGHSGRHQLPSSNDPSLQHSLLNNGKALLTLQSSSDRTRGFTTVNPVISQHMCFSISPIFSRQQDPFCHLCYRKYTAHTTDCLRKKLQPVHLRRSFLCQVHSSFALGQKSFLPFRPVFKLRHLSSKQKKS